MSKQLEEAKNYISKEEYQKALKIARKRHGKDDIEEYLTILDLLIGKDYLPALEEKGLYYQYWDPAHDNGDYGERFFNIYLKKQPKSVNVLSDKALSRFNKGHTDEAIKYINEAYSKYDEYSKVEKPRIKKNEVKMAKIELLVQAKEYNKAYPELNKYEEIYGVDDKLVLYKGVTLQKVGKNTQALDYLEDSLNSENTILALNSRADAYYELKKYKEALKDYKHCIKNEREVDDLELITNFNYKSAYCEIELGNESNAIKHLNKTINMLNEKGRLPREIEEIYQKCSFKKEEIMKNSDIKDEEYKNTRLFNMRTSLTLLAIIVILAIILSLMGYK